jgi:hypothetical protein
MPLLDRELVHGKHAHVGEVDCPSVASKWEASIALTVSQPTPKKAATWLMGSTAQRRATCSASRRVTRA